MKKEWQAPEVEILTVGMTMAGPGIRMPDATQPDMDEMVNHS